MAENFERCAAQFRRYAARDASFEYGAGVFGRLARGVREEIAGIGAVGAQGTPRGGVDALEGVRVASRHSAPVGGDLSGGEMGA
jgi:hypothetical protein